MNKKEQIPSYSLQPLTLSDVGLAGIEKKNIMIGFSTWVRVLMQNWRQGTVGCKGRSEVNRTNKKPWKQKGTGRARAGSARSPLWRGGGVIFGPQPRIRTLRVSQKLKSAILRTMVINSLEKGNILVTDWKGVEGKPSTSQAACFLKSVGLENKKVSLFLPWSDTLNRASFNNISPVTMLFADQLNAYDVSSNGTLLILNKDVEYFKEMVAKWI